jgi:hypothetical protein
MDPQGSRLRQNQNQQAQESLKESSTTEFKSYNSVEDLLRQDAAQNPPPAALANRVASGISKSSQAQVPVKSWWQRLLGE